MRIAACWHLGATRKNSEIPYISHPASVAIILLRAGFRDDALLAAALLHDVIEDTDYSLQQLRNDFPAEVVEFVAALTETKRDEAGRPRSWQLRKEEHIARIAQSGFEARAIVLADKLHNLGTMLFDLQAGEEVWERFHAPPEKVVWYNRTMIDEAAGDDPLLQPLAASGRTLLAQIEAFAKGVAGDRT